MSFMCWTPELEREDRVIKNIYTLKYKCEKCGKVFTGGNVTAEEKCIEKLLLGTDKGDNLDKYLIHDCNMDDKGIAKLIGAECINKDVI